MLIVHITGREALSAWPLGLLVLGSAVSAPLVTRLMRRRGRATGLLASYLVATVGAGLVLLAAARDEVGPLLIGSVLLGTANTAVMLGRYVAADTAPARRMGAAVSAALVAVTVGAVLGPALLGPAGGFATAFGLPALAGLYLLAAIMFPVAAGVTVALNRAVALRTTPPTAAAPEGPGGQLLALAVLGSANLTMVVMMAVLPAHLHLHGWSLSALGVLVAGHIGAMYGPSPLSGWLRDHYGSPGTALLGSVTLLVATGCLVLAAGGHTATASVAGLLLLGLGWNFQLVGGTALLIDRTPRSGRPRAEGLGEVVMGGAAAAGALGLAAPLLSLGGVPLLCATLAALTFVVAIPLVRHAQATRKVPA